MDKATALADLTTTEAFFARSTSALDEEDADFAPAAGAMTVAQHVAHTAQTLEWYLDGAFAPAGMDTNFAQHMQHVQAVTSLAEARAWLERAFARVKRAVEETPDESWGQPIAGEIMSGAPRSSIISAMVDHTAHHRGALATYTRLRGKTPPMPYA